MTRRPKRGAVLASSASMPLRCLLPLAGVVAACLLGPAPAAAFQIVMRR